MLIEEVLCRAHVKATAGRDTRVVSSDGALDLKVSMPRELGGTNGRGTNRPYSNATRDNIAVRTVFA
jgi:organic hydroperoxide reductase OsmC/OhrA